MAGYRLLPVAEDSLVECFRLTLTIWGLAQAEGYKAGLIELFDRLAEQPGMGRRREELAPQLRSFPYQKHVVSYRATPSGGVEIVDIVHGHMDPARWLNLEA